MEQSRSKRLYDASYDQSSDRNSIQNIVRKMGRSLDRISDSEYQSFRKTKRGITNLSELSNKELRFISRDFDIKGFDKSDIKNELLFRKERTSILIKNQEVTPLYSFDYKSQKFSIGYDHKTNEHVISSRFHDKEKNIPIWRPIKDNNISKELQVYTELSSFNVEKHNTAYVSSNASLERSTQNLNLQLEKQFSHQNHLKLDVNSLKNPNQLIGKTIVIKDLDNKNAQFKVLAADKDNLTLEKTFSTNDNYRLVNIDKQLQKSIGQSTKTTAILDSKTIMGYNKDTDTTYVGSILKDNSVKWQSKTDYLKDLSPTGKKDFNLRLKQGRYAHPDIKTIGKTQNGNPIYEVNLANNTKSITANLDKFIDSKSPEAKNLLAYANQQFNTKDKQKVIKKAVVKTAIRSISR